MTKATSMTLGEMRNEVARLDAEQAEAARKEMAAADSARVEYYTDLLARGHELDEMLEAEGKAADDAALAALTAGDLPGAFTGWLSWQRSRVVRGQIRGMVQSGANLTGIVPYTRADLNMATGSFVDWLGWREQHAVQVGVNERIRELAGVIPGTED